MRNISSLAAFLFLAGGAVSASGQGFSITNYQLVSEQRVSRSEYYYTYRADLVNQGPARTAVTAAVASGAPNVSVVAGQNRLHFAPVPANGTVSSGDTFTILVDRSFPFDFSQLVWSFDGPVANAGPNQTVGIGTVVQLNGSGSANPSGIGTLSYSWSFVSRPPGTSTKILNATSVMASFLVDVPGTYVVSLTVGNGAGTDVATMSVSTVNSPPVANAGPARTVPLGALVTLNGSGSSDVDGDPLTYAWTLISIPPSSTAALAGANTVNPSFVADKRGDYLAQLIVNDGKANSTPSTVRITTENTPPVANAGPNQVVNVGSLVQLNGAGSTDVDGDPLTYLWSLPTIPSGSNAKLSDPKIVNPTFTADRPGTYVAQLIVHDKTIDSAPSTMTVTTNAVQAPTANAGPGQTVVHGTTVTLDGSGTDPQGLPLTYTWSLITRPPGSKAALSASNVKNPTFLADVPGLYVAQLFVNNGYLNSTPSTVSITTTNTAPVANAGPDQTVIPGQTVNLNGSGSHDADNDTLKFSWSFTSRPAGSTAVLASPTSPTPSFIADLAGAYVVQLIVSDGFASSSPDTVMVSANPLTITLTPDPLILYNAPGTLTITLGAPAPVGGQLVRLAVVNPAVATVPADVTVPANSTGVNVTVTPHAVGSTLITASAPGYRLATGTITVKTPAITLSVPSSTLGLTRQMTGTATLSAPAPASGVSVNLTANPAGIAGLNPASLLIGAGETSGTFTVTGLAEGSTVIAGSAPGYVSGAVQVTVGSLGMITLPQNVSIILGDTADLPVSLVSPAPAGGAVIALQSADTSKVTISPASVTIPAGATVPAVQPKITGAGAGNAVISASSPGFKGATTTVTVRTLGTIQVPAVLNIAPGASAPFPIVLSSPAPAGGLTVALSSSFPGIAGISPASVSIPAGQTTPAVQPQVNGVAFGNTTITVSAPGYLPATGTVKVGAVLSFSVASLIVPVGAAPSVTLKLSTPAPAGGLVVNLVSSNPAVATVPASRIIPANATNINIAVTGLAAGQTTITASSAKPNITPATLAVTVQSLGGIGTPASMDVNLGQSAPLLITLPAPPAANVTLALATSDATVVGLSTTSVVIPAGQTQPAAPPTVTGLKPASANVTVSATGYSPATVAVHVKATIQFTPNTLSIAGLVTKDLTLTLSGPAPAGGLTVNVSSTNPNIATVPATVTFGAGQTAVAVPVTAAAVGSTSIKASGLNLAETTAQVTVRPPADINLPSGLTLSPGNSAPFPVTLVAPAAIPTFITLTSSNESVAKLSTATVFIQAGQTAPAAQPRIDGLATGEVTITAAAPGLTTATTTVKVNFGLSFTPNTAQVTAGATRNLTLVLSAPAPAGGIQVALSSANTSVATVGASITIPANNTSVNVIITGVAPGTTEIRANATGIEQAVATITVVSPGTITTPGTLNVQLNASVPLPVTLSSAAPAGGVTVTLASQNTARATVTPTVFIPAGQKSPATQPQVTGVNVGPVTITVSAPGFTSASTVVQVSAEIQFLNPVLTMNPGTVQNLLLALNTSAPWGDGLTVNLTSTNTAVATVQASINFYPDGSHITTVTIPVTAVAPGTALIKASGLNIPEVTATINVVGPLSIATVALPDGFQGQPYSFTLTSTGGIDPRTWSLVNGTLPANLTLNGTTGSISGTANVLVTNRALTFRVTDSSNPQQSVSKVLTLTIKQPVAASITATGGTPQTAKILEAFGAPLSATVKDANGFAVPGVTVTFTAPAAGASGTFPGSSKTATAVTNASGVAVSPVFTAGSAVGSYNVTATVAGVGPPANFALTNQHGAAASIAATSGTPQSVKVNTQFPAPLVATVKDSGGNPVPNVTVTFTAPASGASGSFNGGVNTATTNASGVATSAAFQANAISGSYTVTATVAGVATGANFALTNEAGAAASITATGGTPQSAAINTAFALPLSATVKDANNNPVANVTVTFTPPASGASGTFANNVKTAVTNASGVATSAVFTANQTAGAYSVNATAPGIAPPAAFALTNTAGAPSKIEATSGTPQSAAINQAFAQPLVATVRDANNNPVANVTVTFTPPASGASGTFAGGANTAKTNASGVATSAVFTANSIAGAYAVQATIPGGAAPASFQLTNTSGGAASIAATGGTPQSAQINTAFAAPLSVTVKDAGNNPVANVTVTFTAPASGASGTFAGGVNTAKTNASGVATSPVFTANAVAGAYAVNAAVAGVAAPAVFQLTNTPGAGTNITATGGTPQTADVNTAFAQRLVATVKDAGGNPVPNVTVTFTPPATGASGAFSGPNTAVTNASGVATSAVFTANATAGSYSVIATVPNGQNQAAFALTNRAGGAASLTPTAGTTPQTATVGSAFAVRLAVLVKDAGGNPVPNVTVTFTPPASGASGTFAGVNTAVSNASGIAQATVFTANTIAGSYQVSATAPGVAGAAHFALTNRADAPATIVATSGTPQSVAINTPFPSPFVVLVKDTHGNPVPGATVTFTAPANGASGSFVNNAFTALTNTSGVATSAVFRANLTAGSYVVAATVPGAAAPANFALTNVAGTVASLAIAGGNSQNTAVGTPFAQPLSVIAKDGGGNPVPNVTVTFAVVISGAGATFAGGSGSAAVATNASGIATSPVLTANDVAGAFIVNATIATPALGTTFNLTNRPGAPALITVTSGSGQSTAIGTAFAARLVATVRDAKGNVTPNVTVTYTPPAAGASGSFAGGNTAVTNAQGVATSNIFTANSVVGQYQVAATVPGAAQPAVFALENKAGPAAKIEAVAGTPQNTVIKTAFPARLAAKVSDAGNNPVAGVTVIFTLPSSGPSGTFANSANTAVTDASGVATAAVLTANAVAGPFSVTASVSGLGQNASFALTNKAGAAASIVATAGTPQSVAVGGVFGNKLSALVKDDSNNPVPNVTVTFNVPASGASALFAGNVKTATTNAAGIATSATISANTIAGSYLVTGTVPGVATPAAYSLTNLPGAPAAVVVVSGTPQTAPILTQYANPFVVKVTDAFSNAVPNIVVTFTAPASGASGTFANTNTARTNALGVATADPFTANAVSGTFKVNATAVGVAAPAVFDLQNLEGAAAITLTSITVGKNLQAPITVTIPAPAPVGGKEITITSANPGKLLISGRPVETGSNQLVVTVPAGLTQLGGIYVQPLDSTGTVTVSATADGLLGGTATMTLTPSGIVLSGPNGVGVPSFTVSQGVNNTALTVNTARLTPAGDFAEIQQLRGGTTVTVGITNTTPSVGTVTPSAAIGGGDSAATISFNALQPGSTTMTASVPLGFMLPTQNYNSVTANVTPAGLIPQSVTVGQNLQTTAMVQLNGSAPSGGLTVTVTSNDPGKVLFAKTPTAAGSATITLDLDAGFTRTPDFYVYGLVKNSSATYTASAPGFGTANGNITLAPSGFVIYGPNGFGNAFTTTTGANNLNLTVYSALLDASLKYVDVQPLRAGISANVAVTSGNTAVGTITSSPLGFSANVGSAFTQFDPQSGGTTLISLSTPPGFSTPAEFNSLTATVTAPNILPGDVFVGKNMQHVTTVLLGQAAPSGGLQVTLTSQSASLKLAPDEATVGANSITITIPAGQASAQYYVQGFADSGTGTYTAMASGYNTKTATVTFAPSGVVIAGPFGFGFPLNTTLALGDQPVTISTAMLDPVSKQYIERQQLAAGLSLTVTTSNSQAAVGTIPASAVIDGGTDSKVVQFTPLSVGQTTLGVNQPAGYTLPSQYTSLLARVN